MKTKHAIPIILVLFLLPACSHQTARELFVTQQPSPSPLVAVITPTLKIANSTPTRTQTPTSTVQIVATQTPTLTEQVFPTPTSTLVDLESLPKLSDVIISSNDIKNNYDLSWNPLIRAANTTNELKDACLWDCAKYRYSLKEGILTIILLRAGNFQKAENTVENLRKDFLEPWGYEYTANDLADMPPNSWALVDAASSTDDFRTGAAGMAHGSVVILVTYSQRFCENTPEIGRYCEGDTMTLADTSVYFLNAQIQKLEVAGYPR